MHQTSLGRVGEHERFGGRRAVVLGGSIAGLAAAGVLSRHFDEVTVVERDELSDSVRFRKGTPQAKHLHACLLRGLNGFEALFPGTKDELRAAGAVEMQFGRDLEWYHAGGLKASYEGGLIGLAQSRPLLESVIRRHVRALGNVRIADSTEVLGLVRSDNARGVSGVRVRGRREGAAEEALPSDLIVDATGRGSRIGRWFEELGFSGPEVSEIRVDVGYASCNFERPADSAYPWKGFYVLGTRADGNRLGVVAAIEGGLWTMALGGFLKDYPPGDPEGFLEFARSLPHPALYDFIKKEKAIGPIEVHRFPSHQRRHFERLQRLPEGLVGLGDAVASFNPLYGQGMTTAILGCEALDEALRETRQKKGMGRLDDFPRLFFKKLASAIDPPWFMSTSEDLANPEVLGPRPPGFQVMRGFLDRIHHLARTEPNIMRRFHGIQNMVESPATLLHPEVLLPLAKHVGNELRRRFA